MREDSDVKQPAGKCLTNAGVDAWNRPPPKAGLDAADAPNAGVDPPKAGVDWPKPPPKGLLPAWLLPNAELVELKENAAELVAPNAGVLAPNSPPDEEAPPKLNAIAEAKKARVLEWLSPNVKASSSQLDLRCLFHVSMWELVLLNIVHQCH